MSLDPVLLASFSATEARERLVAGDCSVRDYARALLARVDAIESQVQAWAHLDRAHVLAQAGAADEARARGETDGPLFGLPVGVKDVIDTADLPTEHGTVLHAGRMPRDDAAVVRRLRAAGGWVMGKTVTTELATYAPGKTRNPHVPVSSVIRPASFCGVYGFKPSAGLIPRTGVLTQSPAFDAIGVFGRTLDDVALLAQTLTGHDPQDPLTQLRAAPPWLRLAAADAPVPPRLGWVATPFWSRVQPDAQTAFGELLASLEGRVTSFELPASAAEAVGWHRAVMEADIAGSFELEYERGRDRLSASLRGQIERGRQVTAVDYRKALARVPVLLESLDSLFDGCDALLTPATLGTAPAGLESTGDPLMCTLWTYLGMPALSLPLLQGANGLPLGVQLVGRRGDDARLLRTARWLVRTASPDSA